MMKLKQNVTLEEIAYALSGSEGKKAGSEILISCPCHTDKKPSCTIGISEKQQLLIHCQAGCNQEEVYRTAMGILQRNDMTAETKSNYKPKKPIKKQPLEAQNLDINSLFLKVDISSKEDRSFTMGYLQSQDNWNLVGKDKLPLKEGYTKEENQLSFTECIRKMKKSDEPNVSYSFLSFYLFEKQNLVCIDFDDHSNTGKIKEWKKELILPKELNLKASDIESYFCELSQSKAGVHIFLKLKEGAIKKVKNRSVKEEIFEIYKERKQICVTSCLNEEMFISPKVFLQEEQAYSSGVFSELSAQPMVNKTYDLIGFVKRLIYYSQGNFKVICGNPNNKFYLYDSGYWKEGKNFAYQLLGKVSQKMLEEFSLIEDVEQKKDLIKFVNKSMNRSFVEDVLLNCTSQSKLLLDEKTFEEHTGENLLNLDNLTYDFTRKCYRSQKREDYLTKKLNIKPNELARCVKWKEFLNDVFLYDEELINYVQKLIGYVITGTGKERLFVILNGRGKNGKSVFCDVLINALGEGVYGGVLSKECFLWKKNKGSDFNSYLTEALEGQMRFLKTSELASNDVLDDSLVKNVSGCEKVQTRTLRSLPITMKPQFTIFCLTNNLPRIYDYSKGMWDRIKIIPFNASFGTEEGDLKENPNIREELYEEAQGILNWCIEGFVKYSKEGLNEPMIVKKLVSEYKKEEDVLQEWIEEKIEFDVNGRSYVKDCYLNFTEFLAEQGLNKDDFTQKKFTSQLIRQKGFRVTEATNSSIKKFVGVKLREIDDSSDNSDDDSDEIFDVMEH